MNLSCPSVYTFRELSTKRNVAVTGSDVPAVCGENRFQDEKGVLFKKSLGITGATSEACAYGHENEPKAIEAFIAHCGGAAVVHYPDFTLHRKYRWLGGTVDGIVSFAKGDNPAAEKFFRTENIDYQVELAGNTFVLEVKCPLKRKIATGMVPAHYMGQLQTYMEIMDLAACVFLQYRPAKLPRAPNETVSVTLVPRDRFYINLRLPRMYDFWQELMIRRDHALACAVFMQRLWRLRHAATAVNCRQLLAFLDQCSIVNQKSALLRQFYEDRRIRRHASLPIERAGVHEDESLVVFVDLMA